MWKRLKLIPSFCGFESNFLSKAASSTVSSISRHIRRGDVRKVYALHRGEAEAMEMVVHGDLKTSKIIGRFIGDIDFPKHTRIIALVRKDEFIIPNEETMIQSEDHIILFVASKQDIHHIERLFEVSPKFF